MWLIDTETLRLGNFTGDPPPYAILSHRWEEDQEVGFGDLHPSSEHLRGYQKIKDFCDEARRAGFSYGWVDTCCIDKSSSAELSEAINSMFAWYRGAGVCYAYLADVTSNVADDFAQSSWFTRGWTLQELLAPFQVVFFGHGWTPLGDKQDLVTTIETITGIPADALRRFNSGDYCIAHKMTWSAKRQTTRPEDRTYCLLGLFDINMPLLYGEGYKAFFRFQEELMKASLDSTLFCWEGRASDTFGMLAHDPSCFIGVGELRELDPSYEFRRGWTLSNAGLVIPGATVHPYFVTEDGSEIFVLFMDFPFSKEGKTEVWFGIYLLRDDRDPKLSTYRRVSVDGKITGQSEWSSDFPMESPAHDVRISRLPLCEYAITGKREIHFNILVEDSPKIVVRKRPVVQKDDLIDIHLDTSALEWPVLIELANKPGSPTFLDLTFLLAPRQYVGLLCVLEIHCKETRPITIYLGVDHDFDAFGIVIPFADIMDFWDQPPEDIIRSYSILIKAATESNTEIRRGPAQRSFFDRKAMVLALFGDKRRQLGLLDREYNKGWLQNTMLDGLTMTSYHLANWNDIYRHVSGFETHLKAKWRGSVNDAHLSPEQESMGLNSLVRFKRRPESHSSQSGLRHVPRIKAEMDIMIDPAQVSKSALLAVCKAASIPPKVNARRKQGREPDELDRLVFDSRGALFTLYGAIPSDSSLKWISFPTHYNTYSKVVASDSE